MRVAVENLCSSAIVSFGGTASSVYFNPENEVTSDSQESFEVTITHLLSRILTELFTNDKQF